MVRQLAKTGQIPGLETGRQRGGDATQETGQDPGMALMAQGDQRIAPGAQTVLVGQAR